MCPDSVGSSLVHATTEIAETIAPETWTVDMGEVPMDKCLPKRHSSFLGHLHKIWSYINSAVVSSIRLVQ